MKWATGSSRVRRQRAATCFLAVLLAAGCVSTEDARDAINDINAEFRAEYEGILARSGTRTFKVGRDEAYTVMRATMLGLGMRTESESPTLGYLSVYGPAPSPLTLQEWRVAEAADLPKARAIVVRHVGPIGNLFTFEPQGLDIVMNVTVIGTRTGSDISLTMRMRETAPPKSGLPRREYAPPTAVRMGLGKIWTRFEGELRSRRP